MRILLLTTGLKLGGAERQVADLASQFTALGHNVAVVSLTLAQEIELPPGVTLFRVDLRKAPLQFLFTLRAVRKWVEDWCPDIVHAHMFHANIFARLMRAQRSTGNRIPVVCTAHSLREGGWLRMLAYRLTDRWCALTTHVSAEGRQYMLDVHATTADRIRVMPNGIDTDRFRPDPNARIQTRRALGLGPDSRILLNVGRLVPEKAQQHLIEAFAVLRRDPQVAANTHLLIAGDGPLREALSSHAAALGLSHVVRLLGPCSNVPELMNASDVFVLSSVLEGLPLVVAEALACETAVVATDVSGIRSLLAASGTIVAPANIGELATAMRMALRERQDVASGRAHVVATYGLPHVAMQWIQFYQDLSGAGGRSPGDVSCQGAGHA
ncbi:D-inositol-3-phosphate glycosyltransferase [Cupriavidus yeoncheonensis]|uniref:D-inositol-3-phosphate glycosyltransferase n=1 Tax=Cupriavidus yeoncheonensis TaxID=1462994 RepID=A0A916IQZ3_9BURK|nr:glycosyltransferase [Cupriavidus yeoncheonensis]CAG2128470.1 D-inositol-3-phosphate glycosyltransferase [Cupriavidus yeoncheonensis]